ncbi:DNA repair protein RecN [Zeaxanthinibacter enoshimensis]|uniref:DNA repair protein RecN n=1 Tax=Zeaxanthinibacter enoshimensis TaxID=392009 RepID=A0A4R6TPR0_9FLAO|nr:DNA repair protein RecN [Zeaxanthinibacter enoshimensis]TDQ31625.1 DNA repair protein RecN (Recombination protein N) [Zeaxanthinibacter enoshimensis]
MLTHLSIKNFALIDDLNVSFSRGFTTITGETGAGKSILLDGLSMVLGKRADLSSLRDTERKCIIEAGFEVGSFELQPLFEKLDLDYELHTIIRREILPSGKSRAFVNDVPVTLDILTQLGRRLIDIHSQHQTLQLTEQDFQLKVIDAIADNRKLLSAYSDKLKRFRKLQAELEDLKEQQQAALKEQDYNGFLLQELREARLEPGIQEELESEYEALNNVEVIMEQLGAGDQLLNDEQVGVLTLLRELRNASQKLTGFGPKYQSLNERIQALIIEADDIADEFSALERSVESDPRQLELVGNQLRTLYDLQKKHGVTGIDDLLAIREELEKKVSSSEDLEEKINSREKELSALVLSLDSLSDELHSRRLKVLPEFAERMEKRLHPLGMPNASFKLELVPSREYKSSGKETLSLLFSANKGTGYGDLKKIASGGELSRIMLTIKSILAEYEPLPTMMFDEIDTGVSGEISSRMGDIMMGMSKSMQIFTITHLPQVASKGDQHFKVYKIDEDGVTHTKMKALDTEERILELAQMLGGNDVSDSAVAHARQLLN